MQASVFLPEICTTLQIIKIGISKYLQLCIEGGFSQIQSHIDSQSFMYVVPAVV